MDGVDFLVHLEITRLIQEDLLKTELDHILAVEFLSDKVLVDLCHIESLPLRV